MSLTLAFHCELLITQCLLDIDRSAYSSGLVTRTCGDLTTFEDDSSDFNLDRTSVLFQTNRRSENAGFLIVATCVNPEFYNLDGCTQAQTGQTVAPPQSKRETEMASSLHSDMILESIVWHHLRESMFLVYVHVDLILISTVRLQVIVMKPIWMERVSCTLNYFG